MGDHKQFFLGILGFAGRLYETRYKAFDVNDYFLYKAEYKSRRLGLVDRTAAGFWWPDSVLARFCWE